MATIQTNRASHQRINNSLKLGTNKTEATKTELREINSIIAQLREAKEARNETLFIQKARSAYLDLRELIRNRI